MTVTRTPPDERLISAAEHMARVTEALHPRYRLERVAGRGGMATVYLAEDLKHHRRVAIKNLDPALVASIGADRFLREIEIVARLSHPHILPLYDSGDVNGLLYFTMPFIDGGSLRDRLIRAGRLAVSEAVGLTQQVADALAYAHECEVVHRDVKPENILLSRGHALVSDFGVARALMGDSHGDTLLGMTLGTPAYLSPEQALGESTVDGRSDVYSLGCVLHEMLVGQPPFFSASVQTTIARRISEPPPPIRADRPDVSPYLEAVLLRALATDASDRFATAGDFAAALAGVGGARSHGFDASPASGEDVAHSAAALRAQIQLNRGTCYQSVGKPEEAERDIRAAVATAQQLGDNRLLARSHNALLFLHVFIGPPEAARHHGQRGIALAEEAGDRTVAWSAHYGMALLAGLTGDGAAMLKHMERSEQLAGEVQSPLLRLYTDELAMQYAFAAGDWDAGLALAERTIATARVLNQRNLLPRVLVWATHFYIARGEFARAKPYLDEAWELGAARAARGRPIELHTQVTVHGGLATYYMAVGEYTKAIEIGEAGLAVADRAGYVVWATYRLLPVIAEAAFWANDLRRARSIRDRMKRDCDRLGHTLGLVWVDAADGLFARLRKQYQQSADRLGAAIANLESIPWVYDAARLRWWLADVLVKLGDRAGAARELRKSHEVCAALGAKADLERARNLMKKLGVRLPAKGGACGRNGATLTDRERELARLIVARKSNKEIAVALGISTRTVTTHLANMFAKVGVASRGEFADAVREAGLLDDPTDD